MNATIVSALIAAAATLLVCILTNKAQQKRQEAQQMETRQLFAYKLDELTKKVEKHNGLVERMYRIEEKASLYEEKMRVANHRIKDLEKHTGHHCKEEYHE